MKIIKMLKEKKAIIAMVSVLAVFCIGATFIAMTAGEPKDIDAIITGAEKAYIDRGEEETHAQIEDGEDKNHAGEKMKDGSDKKSSESADLRKGGSNAAKGVSNNISMNDSKNSEKEKKEQTKSVHVHAYNPVEGTKTVTYEVPIIGDWCTSCNRDYTGRIEKHIMETSCRGYVTDVVVGYETVSEDVPYIYYKCSCGAVK